MSDEVKTDTIEVNTEPKTDKPEVKITDSDKERFFKSFLSDEPFEDDYDLFNGKVPIVFRTLSLDENDIVFKQISFDQAKGIAKSDDSYILKIVEYRLAGCLVSVNEQPFCEDITPESHPPDAEAGTTYLTERLKVMQKWQTQKLGAMTKRFNEFEAKVQKLTDESFSENF
jgi:hypothetical protein